MVLTCNEHNGGTHKLYVHPPRQPYHIIPSEKGDQLCHAVIKPRLIKPMKASKYCIKFQMHEQRGSFQGIDTCDVVMFGNFSFTSFLLDQSESRSIKYRPDINALLDTLYKDGRVSKDMVDSYRERARFSNPPEDVMDKCRNGATYIDMEDEMLMQHEIGSDKNIKVICDEDSSDNEVIISVKRTWVRSIIYSHKMDSYGSRFPIIPQFKCKGMD